MILKTILTTGCLVLYCLASDAQNVVILEYDGLSPNQFSPFRYQKHADHGIQNPERGFEIKAGVIDLFTKDFHPDPNYDYNYFQYQEKGDEFYENIIEGDPSLSLPSLETYLKDNFCEDGISLVEIEEYVNFTKLNLEAQTPYANKIFRVQVLFFSTLKSEV